MHVTAGECEVVRGVVIAFGQQACEPEAANPGDSARVRRILRGYNEVDATVDPCGNRVIVSALIEHAGVVDDHSLNGSDSPSRAGDVHLCAAGDVMLGNGGTQGDVVHID